MNSKRGEWQTKERNVERKESKVNKEIKKKGKIHKSQKKKY